MEYKITTEYCGREYEHGSVEVVKSYDCERQVEVKLDFTTSEDQMADLVEEIQKLVRKYAI